jgi:hypothetical protein
MTDRERLDAIRKALALDAGWAEHRIAWLESLLSELRNSGWAYRQDDPCASWLALDESRLLLAGLTAAFADELDAQLEAERAALGEVPGPDDEELPF